MPHHVEHLERRPHALDPPCVPVRRHRVPSVNRIAPQLPRRAEIVGRHPGDHRGPIANRNSSRLRPHVRAVLRDVDGNVAHDARPRVCGAYWRSARHWREEQELPNWCGRWRWRAARRPRAARSRFPLRSRRPPCVSFTRHEAGRRYPASSRALAMKAMRTRLRVRAPRWKNRFDRSRQTADLRNG